MIREIVSAAQLDIYPQIGLALFLICFVAILVRVFFMSKGAAHYASRMPLQDGQRSGEASHE